jgi:hypothetical protein
MLTKEHAQAWVRTVAALHLPKNATSYKFQPYVETAQQNTLGLMTDLQPQEGKVVEVSPDYCLVKTDRTRFFVAARHLLESVPEVGSTVRITPYARKNFDGARVDAPKTEVSGGVVFETFTIGRITTRLPIVNREGIRCPELLDTINLIEDQLTPDRCRSLSQALVDFGAGGHPIGYKDPLPSEIIDVPPTLQFRVSTKKFQGNLVIIYDRAGDHYVVQLTEPNTAQVVQSKDLVFNRDLAAAVVELLDDGAWRIAKVEVLKAAPKRRAPKADLLAA